MLCNHVKYPTNLSQSCCRKGFTMVSSRKACQCFSNTRFTMISSRSFNNLIGKMISSRQCCNDKTYSSHNIYKNTQNRKLTNEIDVDKYSNANFTLVSSRDVNNVFGKLISSRKCYVLSRRNASQNNCNNRMDRITIGCPCHKEDGKKEKFAIVTSRNHNNTNGKLISSRLQYDILSQQATPDSFNFMSYDNKFRRMSDKNCNTGRCTVISSRIHHRLGKMISSRPSYNKPTIATYHRFGNDIDKDEGKIVRLTTVSSRNFYMMISSRKNYNNYRACLNTGCKNTSSVTFKSISSRSLKNVIDKMISSRISYKNVPIPEFDRANECTLVENQAEHVFGSNRVDPARFTMISSRKFRDMVWRQNKSHKYISKCSTVIEEKSKEPLPWRSNSKSNYAQNKFNSCKGKYLDIRNVAALPPIEFPYYFHRKKKQKRCQTCSRNIGLYGFTCRCNGLFCSIHRYTDMHECKCNSKAAEAVTRKNE